MGYYSHLYVDNQCVFSGKNEDPPGMDVLFDPQDERRVEKDDNDDSKTEVIVADRDLVRFRLNVNGYSLGAAQETFERWGEFIEKKPELPDYFKPASLSRTFFQGRSFDGYVADVLRHMRGDPGDDIPYAGNYLHHFPSEDPLAVIGALIHKADGLRVRATIEMDGDSLLPLTSGRRKLLVITEGKTDASFLHRGIQAIAPQYAQELQFVDYTHKPRAGASEITHLLKAFAAAGVDGPVLAILDNDTAGHQELRTIRALRLPKNFCAIAYPDIDLAKNYPTLGPSGPQHMNVNGTACSIEMYFGVQALTVNGELSPVRWTGFNEVLQRYQGEVRNKSEIQQRIEDQLVDLEAGRMATCTSGLLALLNAIVAATTQLRLVT